MARSVSVVVPCARMAGFLPDAVASIMVQAPPAAEILVVRPEDDLETDEACSGLSAAGAPVRVLTTTHRNPAAARNVAIDEARGDLIGFLDADDLWAADKLEKQIKRLCRSPAVDVVGGVTMMFDTLARRTRLPAEGSRTEETYSPNLGTLLCRRSVFDRVGKLNEALRYAEDVDFLLRTRDAGIPYTVLPRVTLYYRQHSSSMMRQQNPRLLSDFRRAMLASARRRRAQGLAPATEQLVTGHLEPENDEDS